MARPIVSPSIALQEVPAVTLSKEQKQGIIGKFKIHEADSGSPEVQIALLTEKIGYLTEHFKIHKRDHAPFLILSCLVLKEPKSNYKMSEQIRGALTPPMKIKNQGL